jgi:hypothetical protein
MIAQRFTPGERNRIKRVPRGIQFWRTNRRADWKIASRFVNITRVFATVHGTVGTEPMFSYHAGFVSRVYQPKKDQPPNAPERSVSPRKENAHVPQRHAC